MADALTGEESSILTYQDFERSRDKGAFALAAINAHLGTRLVETAKRADRYDRQLNDGIMQAVQLVNGSLAQGGQRIASNFFHRLNTQRCMYSLGNGIEWVGEDVDFGRHFDYDVQGIAYKALIHGVCFGFWNVDRLHMLPVTEFVPLWDERDGSLRAGIRFWRIASSRPLQAVLYEEDGYTRLVQGEGRMKAVEEKRAYIEHVIATEAHPDESVIAGENYGTLPIVPCWGSKLHQSTLLGMEKAIDAYDLIRSGFADDLKECAQIYWLVENRGGMDDQDLREFLERLRKSHIANADTSQGGKVTPYTQDVPYQARESFLSLIRQGIYEDFGALDVHMVEAGATNDHIQAAYQPLDEEADDFEYQVSEFLEHIARLAGVEAEPVFKRNRVSNQLETVQMVTAEAQWLDDETVLRKLPNVTPEEIDGIMERKGEQVIDMSGLGA